MIAERNLTLKVNSHLTKGKMKNRQIKLMVKYNFLGNLLKYFNKNKIKNDYNYL